MTGRNRLQRLPALAGVAAMTVVAALATGACGSPPAGDGDALADTAAAWPEPGAPQPEDTVPLDRTPPVEPAADAPRAPAAPGTPGQPAPQPPPASGAMETLTGRLAVTGAQPMTFVTLQPETGVAVQLFGPHDAELRRLAGAVVRVEGIPATGRMPGPALTVQRYELVSVDGQRPYVGVLEERNGAYRLGGTQPVRLIGVPAELAGRAGATVWVVGEREGDAVRLQSYGVIRP